MKKITLATVLLLLCLSAHAANISSIHDGRYIKPLMQEISSWAKNSSELLDWSFYELELNEVGLMLSGTSDEEFEKRDIKKFINGWFQTMISENSGYQGNIGEAGMLFKASQLEMDEIFGNRKYKKFQYTECRDNICFEETYFLSVNGDYGISFWTEYSK